MGTWGTVIEGTSTGPTLNVETNDDSRVQLQALWSDDTGIVVSLDACDVELTVEQCKALAAALTRLAELTPPVVV